jgi:hypothetical protein
MIRLSAAAHVFDIFSSQRAGGLTKTNEAQEENYDGLDYATYQPIKPGWG